MKEKHYILIKTLVENGGWMTAKQLATVLHVSTRSIKTYIQDVNKTYENVILSSRYGYQINAETKDQVLKQNPSSFPQTSNERVAYIINRLVKTKDGYDAYTLCDELYISMSTLKNELKKVRRKISTFDLVLHSQNDILMLEGIEKNKRKLVSSILYDESSVNFVNLASVQKNFTNINIDYIKQVVTTTFERNHYFVNDYSLINLILHITIAIDRIQNNYSNYIVQNERSLMKVHEYELAQQVAKQLEVYFNITYSDDEVYELALLLISHANTLDYNTVTASNLESFIGKECLTLVEELVNDVNAFYYINLSEPEFLIRFALHVRSLLIRCKYNYSSKNPLADGIQMTCPLIYDAAVNLCSTIEERTGLHVNRDEIAYIAFHIGSALETQKAIHDKIKVLLYCPDYYDMSMRLVKAINDNFSQSILIKNVITSETEFEHLNVYDLIITTIPISMLLPTPTILVSFLLNQKDCNMIHNKINEIRVEKKQQMISKHLNNLMKDTLFERNENLTSIDDTIPHMCNTLIQLGYIDEHFEDELWIREKMASTAYNTVAVPHALKMNANHTSISILISEKGIVWNTQIVHLVLMLTFNKNERYIFNEIFDTLSLILTDPENIKKITSAKTYQECIQSIVSLIYEP